MKRGGLVLLMVGVIGLQGCGVSRREFRQMEHEVETLHHGYDHHRIVLRGIEDELKVQEKKEDCVVHFSTNGNGPDFIYLGGSGWESGTISNIVDRIEALEKKREERKDPCPKHGPLGNGIFNEPIEPTLIPVDQSRPYSQYFDQQSSVPVNQIYPMPFPHNFQ